MKNALEKLAVIGSIALATAFGSDSTNQPYNTVKMAGYNVQIPTNASSTLLRFIDRVNQESLGHATNVSRYNPKTGESEKRQVWKTPVKINGYVVGYEGDSNSVPVIFEVPVPHPLGFKQSVSFRRYLMGPTPKNNSDSNSVPVILKSLSNQNYRILSDEDSLKVRGSPNPKIK